MVVRRSLLVLLTMLTSLVAIADPDETVADEVRAVEAATRSSGTSLVVIIGSLLLAGLGLIAVSREYRNWRSRRKPTG